MSDWNKKNISKDQVESFKTKYKLDALSASILIRRGITEGSSILYFMEDDLRFQHSPFSFSNMEDAVDRINDAIEEKEKILIFGDRDVDGVSATTVLFECLSSLGADVSYRLPKGDEAYGLSILAVEEFAKEYGSLIITVDCGISNNAEVARAAELGLDVIIADHHNPQENIPSPAIIINPKCEDSGYPFKDISGCAVVFKLVSALRFSRSKWYKQPVTLLNVMSGDETWQIDCIKLRNLVPLSRLTEKITPGERTIGSTRLPSYLQGEIILVWDMARQQKLLSMCFGDGTDFNVLDIRPLISQFVPSFAAAPLAKIKELSKIARYGNHAPTEIGGFYNIYVTYVQMALKQVFPDLKQKEERDLQLVALAALADIMPMKDENRIFVRKALASINAGKIRPGLLELMASLNMLGKRVTSKDLSWTLIPSLNAAGRLGQPELAADLFITDDVSYREMVAEKIKECNIQRKQLSEDAAGYVSLQAKASIPLYHDKMCVVIDERINRGITGLVAARLAQQYSLPAIAVTFVDDRAVGSIRSSRGADVSDFLNRMGDVFLNHGGHTHAGGFSFERAKLAEFEEKVAELSMGLELDENTSDNYDIDAEIPANYLTPDLLSISDSFEPYGLENEQLLFMSQNLEITDGMILGKGEKQHLKIELSCGRYKWPALFWNKGSLLHSELEVGDRVDLLYHLERNSYRGNETPQLIIVDLKKHDGGKK